MRFTLYIATMAVCLIALQCTPTNASEGNHPPPPPPLPPPTSGEHSDPATVDVKQVSVGSGGPHPAAAGGGAGNPDGSLAGGSSGSVLAGGPADKTVTTTTTSTAVNADAQNLMTAADQSQSLQGTAQHDAAHGTLKTTIQGAEQTHDNPSGVLPNEPDVVTTTTTKPVTQLGDTGSEIKDRDRAADEGHTHQAGPPTTVSTPNAAPKQITSTPSRNTVEGEQQRNGRQPSTTPDAGKPVLKDTNTGFSSGEQVHAPELPLEPHTDKGVSKDLTKTQQAQEQSPPLSVQPQTPQSTTTVKENITPLVPHTSTTTGTNKDAPQNNNPPTTSTAGELKVPAKTPPASTKVYTNGDNETMPSAKSIASTSEPAKVESTAHLTPLPKLPDALQSLGNKDSSIGSSLHFALTALATLVVMADAPTF